MADQRAERRLPRLLRPPILLAPRGGTSGQLSDFTLRRSGGTVGPALVVLTVALAARLWHLTSFDLWTDEVHTLTIARTGEYSFGPAYRLAPLNFLLTRWAIDALGPTELAGRLVPLLAGLATVLATFLIGERWIGRRASFVAAILLAISPWHVYWSQNARHFALVALFVLLATHTFLLYWKGGSRVGLALTPIFLALALASHSSGGFYLAALLGFVGISALVWAVGRRGRGGPVLDRRHALALVALGLLLAAYVPVTVSVSRYLAANNQPWNPLSNLIGSLLFYVPPYLVMAAIAGAVFLWYERDDLGVICGALVVIPVILLALASRVTIASAPYVLPSLVPVVWLTGVAIDRLLALAGSARARVPTALLAVGIIGAQAFELTLYHTRYRGLKPRWRDAVEFVRSRRGTNDVVVAAEADVARFYLPTGDIRWYGATEDDRKRGSFPPVGASGIWYIVYTTDEPLVDDAQAARSQTIGSKELKQLFPLSYGPKDRTLGVFYEPLTPITAHNR